MSCWSGAARCLALACIGLTWMGCDRFSSGQTGARDPDYLRAKSKWNQRDFVGAVKSYEAALRTDPNSADAHREMGILYYQDIKDPAAAVYHLRKYLALRKDANNADTIRGFIDTCKMDLAREVPLSVSDERIQKALDTLAAEKASLEQQLKIALAENEKLRTQLGEAGNPVVVGQSPREPVTRPDPFTGPEVPSDAPRSPERVVPTRTHVIRKGDTLYSLGKRYGVAYPKILGANPGLDENRLPLGREIRIPSN